jgi:hypothetical protein
MQGVKAIGFIRLQDKKHCYNNPYIKQKINKNCFLLTIADNENRKCCGSLAEALGRLAIGEEYKIWVWHSEEGKNITIGVIFTISYLLKNFPGVHGYAVKEEDGYNNPLDKYNNGRRDHLLYQSSIKNLTFSTL